MAAWRSVAWLRNSGWARTLTTSVPAGAAAQPVKVPIQVFGLEGRYAHAMFSAASKKKSLEKVEEELKDFQKLMDKSPKLTSFMFNPTIRKQQKQAALAGVLKEMKYSDLTKNLFDAMAENNRLTKAPSVIKAYGTIMSAYRGEVSCTVTSAKTLDNKSLKEVETVLQQFVDKGQKLNIELKVQYVFRTMIDT